MTLETDNGRFFMLVCYAFTLNEVQLLIGDLPRW